MSKIGVILLAFGGADSLDAVEPFMTNLMGGRKPSPQLLERTIGRYKLIGGGSTLPQVTRKQAADVEKILNESGDYRVLPGMCYWHPFIGEAISELCREGIRKIIAVSLSPHFSTVSTGAYQKEIEKAVSEIDEKIEVEYAPGWYDHPLFIAALEARIKETFDKMSVEERAKTTLIFSAHSLPVKYIVAGDPYTAQLQKTVEALNDKFPELETKLGFQSKGGGPGQGEWLGPETEAVMDSLEPEQTALVVPIGFACDHIETLYDIDVLQKEYAHKTGRKFYRAIALNTHPLFMQCLADVIRQSTK